MTPYLPERKIPCGPCSIVRKESVYYCHEPSNLITSQCGQNTNQLGGDYVVSAGGVSDDINTFYRFTVGPCLVLITGHFRVTSGGTIIPSITLGAATAAKIKTGSYFKCVRVGADTDNASSGWS